MIKNFELITDKVQNFSFTNIKGISKFDLSFLKEFDVNTSILDIDFVLEGNDNRHLAKFRFHNPQNIKFESSGFYHQISLKISDITERSWENKKFEVEDYEENTLRFYCSEVEIIDVLETNYDI